MDDQAVIERLRSDLRTQRDETAAPDWLLGAGHRRWRRRRARRAGAGAVLGAVVLVAVVLTGGWGDDPGAVDTGPAGPGPVETIPTTSTWPPWTSTTATTAPPLPTGPPSQSSEDAARDGIPSSVAALPLAARVGVQAEEAAPEGRWTLSETADPRLPCGAGEPGDVSGVDVLCGWDEVLLRDDAGTILRAYPLWEMTSSWIHLTPDAVFGGRVGDGAQPYSTIFRIDRSTLELTGLIWADPGQQIGPGGLAPTTPDAWSLGPDTVRFDLLVTYGPDIVGTAVTSVIGPISVDVDAIEALFAEG
ncbi:MAG TPA: hypothetical protein VK507_20270 [Iamia sp.]|nr:hypothetical protein [Iamia sp.]